MIWTDTKTAILLAVINLVFVCLGFYLGRITQGRASGPALPRIFPEKAADPDEDLYYDAMHGEDQEIIPTVEVTK